jgi:hypothetical protein
MSRRTPPNDHYSFALSSHIDHASLLFNQAEQGEEEMQEVRKCFGASLACLLTSSALSPALAHRPDTIRLLPEFRPIGGAGNNLLNPQLDAIPGSPELNIAPLNFSRGANDQLVSGPNPRTISNIIAGGTGANGENAETTDPVASALRRLCQIMSRQEGQQA